MIELSSNFILLINKNPSPVFVKAAKQIQNASNRLQPNAQNINTEKMTMKTPKDTKAKKTI